MIRKMTSAQLKGALILLLIIITIAGWRYRKAFFSEERNYSVEKDSIPENEKQFNSFFAKIDINRADSAELTKVKGIGPTLARRIVRYRELVGGFESTEDLLKVYGIFPENFVRIEEQIEVGPISPELAANARITKTEKQDRIYFNDGDDDIPGDGNIEFGSGKNEDPRIEKKSFTVLNINEADSAQLDALPGIGAKTASNIIKYRNLIFFYHSPDQLGEVWGIRPENLEKMKPWLNFPENTTGLKKIRINQWDKKQLASHYYLDYKNAGVLLAYREMHGPFTNYEAILKVQAVDKNVLEKIKPYLDFSTD